MPKNVNIHASVTLLLSALYTRRHMPNPGGLSNGIRGQRL